MRTPRCVEEFNIAIDRCRLIGTTPYRCSILFVWGRHVLGFALDVIKIGETRREQSGRVKLAFFLDPGAPTPETWS